MTTAPGLTVEIESAAGTRHRWHPDAPADRRPQGVQFTTGRGEGFKTATVTLPRRLDLDSADLGLLRTLRVVDEQGRVAWEGRISALPRSTGPGGGTVTVQAVGWMAHARDRKHSRIYVDRDYGRWAGMSTARRGELLTASYGPVDAQRRDDTGGNPAVITELSGAWTAASLPVSEAWYDAGAGNTIARVDYAWTRDATISANDTSWVWEAYLLDGDTDDTAFQQSGNLRGVGPASGTLTATASTRRHAMLQLRYTTGPQGADNTKYGIQWRKLAVIGHPAPTLVNGLDDLPAVTASEVFTDVITRMCPLLNTAGIEATTYPIAHLAFPTPVDPYDILLAANAYHLWDFGVWEDRCVKFAPTDLTDFDWQVRSSDPGVTVDLHGDDTSSLYKGVAVTYTNVATGRPARVTPDTHTELTDSNPLNPANIEGVPRWFDIAVSFPVLTAQAVEIGRVALAEQLAPRAPGTITVQGTVRDRTGTPQPAYRVRAGDRIILADTPNDAPRLVHETSYDHARRTVSVSVDGPAKRLDAILDRQTTALAAANLA